MDEPNTCSWYDPACSLAWLRDELQALALWVWDSILSGGAATLEAIPVPLFLQNICTQTLPAGVTWFAAAFQIDVGLAIIVSAYTARFILRRIPVIG